MKILTKIQTRFAVQLKNASTYLVQLFHPGVKLYFHE